MSLPEGTRGLVRRRAGYRCEFCGVHENDAGGELTLDHYRPRSCGGSDSLDNLIYACSRCNLYKHDYWPVSEGAPRIWNPRREEFATHFATCKDGSLKAKTPGGTFTLRLLRLNRPQLIAHRRRQKKTDESLSQLGVYQGIVLVQEQLLNEYATVADQQKQLLEELHGLLKQRLDEGGE